MEENSLVPNAGRNDDSTTPDNPENLKWKKRMAKKKPPYTTKKKAAQSPAVKAKKGIKKKVVRKPKPETAGLLPPKNMDPEDFEHIAQEFKRLKQQGFTLRQLLAAGHKLLDKYGK